MNRLRNVGTANRVNGCSVYCGSWGLYCVSILVLQYSLFLKSLSSVLQAVSFFSRIRSSYVQSKTFTLSEQHSAEKYKCMYCIAHASASLYNLHRISLHIISTERLPLSPQPLHRYTPSLSLSAPNGRAPDLYHSFVQ